MQCKKYITIFKISWARELEYRFNFFLGRLRNIIVLLLLYYVWFSLTKASGSFAGFSQAELFTYIFGVNILRSVIFGAQSRQTAFEIDSGELSAWLVKPINYFWLNFCRELAQRCVNFLAAILEVGVFIFILKTKLVGQTDIKILSLFAVSIILAVFLYYILSYLASLIAFWSREAMGPRFLFEWFLEFASGAYFPLSILSKVFFVFLSYLPFMYIIYLPISIYLGGYELNKILLGLAWQIFWIAGLGALSYLLWQKGLKKYSGEGI